MTRCDNDDHVVGVESHLGRAVEFYDDGQGRLWLCSSPCLGYRALVTRCRGEDALSIAIDQGLPINTSDLPAAFGFDSDDEFKNALAGGDEMELAHGYEFQDNAWPGSTCIVYIGDGVVIERLTSTLAADVGLVITTAPWEVA